MSKVFKPRRGSADQVAAFVGETNEVILNTTTNTLHVMDGLTAGGFPLARADEVAQKDAEQDESLDALCTLIAEEVAKLLPLDGSRVMTGALGFGPYLGVREEVSADNAGMNISASSSDKKGAYLILRSNDAGGGFILSSRNEAGSASLIGDPAAKTLTWLGKNLVRSVNGVSADAAGAVDIAALASGWGMPSGKYSDLRLGASGTNYTAPANGYYTLQGTASAVNGWTMMTVNKNGMRLNLLQPAVNMGFGGYVPCQKGDVVNITYASFAKTVFRFIYAEGAV